MQAVPGTGLNVPLWILGSSLFGAQLAGLLGLPYAFASHFAPDALMQALQVYRAKFQPSRQLDRPYAMVGVNVIVAETDEEARRLFTSVQQSFTNLFRGTRGRLMPPIDDIEAYWSPMEKLQASNMLACSFVGSRETVRAGLERFIAQTGADELMVATAVYDQAARLRSTSCWPRSGRRSRIESPSPPLGVERAGMSGGITVRAVKPPHPPASRAPPLPPEGRRGHVSCLAGRPGVAFAVFRRRHADMAGKGAAQRVGVGEAALRRDLLRRVVPRLQ